jgi:exodeoxyribonuclease VII large subunit
MRAPTPSAAAELAVTELRLILENLNRYAAVCEAYIRDKLDDLTEKLNEKAEKVHVLSPEARTQKAMEILTMRQNFFFSTLRDKIAFFENGLKVRAAAIEKLSPLAVLGRGYTLIEKDGKVSPLAESLHHGDDIKITFSDGTRNARIME